MSHVTVIVLTWNGRQWLDGCLGSLLALDPPAGEILVVDNGSSDGTVEYVQRTYAGVRVLALDSNRGFAGGNNAGAAAANGVYLAFLNNDTRVASDWLGALVAPVEGNPDVGLVASNIVYMDRPGVVDSAGDGYLRCGGAFKHAHGWPRASAPGGREVFGACGAAFLIRRDLFESLGGFDEDFFMVYEDVDLSFRARLRGAACVYAADAIVWHAGSASLGPSSSRAVFFGQRNLEWTWIKNVPTPLLWRTLVVHIAYDLAAALAYARRGQFGTWCRAKWSALSGLRMMLRKRRRIQSAAVVPPETLWRLMDADWIAVKRREKQFDFTPPGT